MKKTILAFSLLILALLLLFQFSKYSIVTGNAEIEIIFAVIAIVFFVVGYVIHKKSLTQKHMGQGDIDNDKIKALDISDREYEVLQLIHEGLSNKEIGEKLFLSESTIKTHVSSLLVKLNAKRRTQAIQIAKSQHII
ncbi:response regulator transcription factor [Winogradskyella aurantia]|uniref:Helix-turn-helix transcriptional regulator n=1 Tax=Winogradskyella aurantia TaxID=1915063 RepID=A0A265V0D4_9FLAO|nr:response regulator transcription factor [Winogradskyella aurantia]OZV71021.1 helix-turn-helix transcriptional regulator [Winogradskyella aurantia]